MAATLPFHPVAPLLLLLAPLLRPFRCPVRGLGRAATGCGNTLIFLFFCSCVARRGGPRKSLCPVIGAKTGGSLTEAIDPPERLAARGGGAVGQQLGLLIGSMSSSLARIE